MSLLILVQNFCFCIRDFSFRYTFYRVYKNPNFRIFYLQKEEKIKLLKDRLSEKEAGKGGVFLTPPIITQGKDNMIVADFITDAGTSDSAFGGISFYTRSSRASQSDLEFSESYL